MNAKINKDGSANITLSRDEVLSLLAYNQRQADNIDDAETTGIVDELVNALEVELQAKARTNTSIPLLLMPERLRKIVTKMAQGVLFTSNKPAPRVPSRDIEALGFYGFDIDTLIGPFAKHYRPKQMDVFKERVILMLRLVDLAEGASPVRPLYDWKVRSCSRGSITDWYKVCTYGESPEEGLYLTPGLVVKTLQQWCEGNDDENLFRSAAEAHAAMDEWNKKEREYDEQRLLSWRN